jgi:hypothetical protein
MNILGYLPVALVAGLLGMAAMELVMWLICRRGWAKGNMIVALGSLITRRRENAFFVGGVTHVIAAFAFALIYTIAMVNLGLAHFPASLATGLGFGALHGMVVTLGLVWVVAEQHPLEEFQDAGLAIGVSHIAGHVAYGAVVGAVIGLWMR